MWPEPGLHFVFLILKFTCLSMVWVFSKYFSEDHKQKANSLYQEQMSSRSLISVVGVFFSLFAPLYVTLQSDLHTDQHQTPLDVLD